MSVLSPLHINYPFSSTMYIVLTCSNKEKIDMSHWEGKHFSTTGACREEILNANNKLTFGQKVKEAFSEYQYWPVIVVFQSYSEADKFKHIVNIAMPFWEKASCSHRCYASPLLLVTIAIEDGRWMVTGMGRGCKVMSGPGHLELLLSLTSYRDHPGHKQMFCIVFMFPYWSNSSTYKAEWNCKWQWNLFLCLHLQPWQIVAQRLHQQ